MKIEVTHLEPVFDVTLTQSELETITGKLLADNFDNFSGLGFGEISTQLLSALRGRVACEEERQLLSDKLANKYRNKQV